jgi:HEAT repeat protein
MHHKLKCLIAIALVVLALGCGARSQPDGKHEGNAVGGDTPAEPRAILDRLNSADPLERACGTRLLGESDQSTDSALPLLLTALEDPNYLVRSRAAEALGNIGDDRAVRPLMDALKRGAEYPEVRSRAAEALGQLKATEAVEPLTESLTGMVWNVRYQAVIALGRIGDPAARDAVEQVVRYDPNFSVRAVAREALQELEEIAGNEHESTQ